MSDIKITRLSKIARELNVGISTIVEFLHKKGINIDSNPNTKITPEQHDLLLKEYSTDLNVKKESEKLNLKHLREKHESISLNDIREPGDAENQDFEEEILIKDTRTAEVPFEKEVEIPHTKATPIKLNILGKMDVDKLAAPKKAPAEKVPVEPVKVETIGKKAKESEPVIETPVAKVVPEQAEIAEVEEVEKEIVEVPEEEEDNFIKPEIKELEVKVVGKIDLDSMNQRTRPPKKTKQQKEEERRAKIAARKKEQAETKPERVIEYDENKELIQETEEETGFEADRLTGPAVIGKISLLPPDQRILIDEEEIERGRRKKRQRIKKDSRRVDFDAGVPKEIFEEDKFGKKKKKKKGYHSEINLEDVDRQIKDTFARLYGKGKSKGAKYRREKRDIISQRLQQEEEQKEKEKNILRVTEFVTVNELANLMNVPVNEVIATCMTLGVMVSINQRLDAETLVLVAEEFNYKVEFVTVELQESIEEEQDDEKDLAPRPPIVTVMGHVDHGKTKLLDYIRNTNVIAGEAGGITQHIGAYSVVLEDGRQLTFLDTPGHEAFTAMRARGAQITDVAIIVVAADDGVMPQTVEAINHAQAAGVPMVFAINKIDKPTANPDKIKEALANMNILVEDWGGKYQSQEISAKSGLNVSTLLDKVLLEAELLDLKANPKKRASGTVIESSLDKGRGYIATVLVQSGTLHIGDIMLAGYHYGRVKAMFNERGKKIDEAGPSTPVLVLGLNGAPQAGDKFNVMTNEKEAKEIAIKREQLQREQGIRTQKHITLDEIGRRIAIGNFKELNIIVKGDVDGSVEALSDSLIKLSNEEIQVNVIHKAVGQISEGDILLAAASNAIVIGFQVRPSMQARRLAEKEQIDIRLYSIIYDAINEIKSAMEGMLSPEIKEEITATLEVLETFKITKVGTVAGCMVKEGKIKRSSKVRVIREGIVVYSGELASLKRFKDDVKEVVSGQECGLNIENYNDLKVGDIIEAYETVEIKKKL
jgi:translation initiation factor IF-2